MEDERDNSFIFNHQDRRDISTNEIWSVAALSSTLVLKCKIINFGLVGRQCQASLPRQFSRLKKKMKNHERSFELGTV